MHLQTRMSLSNLIALLTDKIFLVAIVKTTACVCALNFSHPTYLTTTGVSWLGQSG